MRRIRSTTVAGRSGSSARRRWGWGAAAGLVAVATAGRPVLLDQDRHAPADGAATDAVVDAGATGQPTFKLPPGTARTQLAPLPPGPPKVVLLDGGSVGDDVVIDLVALEGEASQEV